MARQKIDSGSKPGAPAVPPRPHTPPVAPAVKPPGVVTGPVAPPQPRTIIDPIGFGSPGQGGSPFGAGGSSLNQGQSLLGPVAGPSHLPPVPAPALSRTPPLKPSMGAITSEANHGMAAFGHLAGPSNLPDTDGTDSYQPSGGQVPGGKGLVREV
jgi:hypothetical protein